MNVTCTTCRTGSVSACRGPPKIGRPIRGRICLVIFPKVSPVGRHRGLKGRPIGILKSAKIRRTSGPKACEILKGPKALPFPGPDDRRGSLNGKTQRHGPVRPDCQACYCDLHFLREATKQQKLNVCICVVLNLTHPCPNTHLKMRRCYAA